MIPYQFVVLRYVHSAASQEFANVGLVMWLSAENRVIWRISDHYHRLTAFFGEFDGAAYREIVRLARRRLGAAADELDARYRGGTLFGQTPKGIAEFVTPLFLPDASVLQSSKIMSGITKDAVKRFESLYTELVEGKTAPRERKDERAILVAVESVLGAYGVRRRLESHVRLSAPDYNYEFRLGWRNGTRQVLEPISFDYKTAADVLDKANTWSGRLLSLSKGDEDFSFTGVAGAPSDNRFADEFEHALRILSQAPNVRRIVRDDQIAVVAQDIADDLAAHPDRDDNQF